MKTSRPMPFRPFATALAVSAALALGACSSGDDDDDADGATGMPATGEPMAGEPMAGEPMTGGPESPATGAPAEAASVAVTLGTAAEVPPVAVAAPDATGTGTLEIDATGAASGEVVVSGLTGQATMAHIHRGFAGSAGPVIAGGALEGSADGLTWTVPAGLVLADDDLAAFRRGELYFNVHTADNPAGEVRGQIVPVGTSTFTVRIENVSTPETLNVTDEDGTVTSAPVPLSPGAFIVHRDESDSPLLLPRDAANAGLEGVAEDGDPAPYVTGETRIAGATVFDTPLDAEGPGPAAPGLAYEFTFTAVPGDKLGFVTMFVQSNDWFYTPTDEDNSLALFGDDGAAVSGDVTDQIGLWDAGTEADEVPGAGDDQVLRQAAANTGSVDIDTSVGSLEARGQTAPDLDGAVIQVTVTPAP